MTARSLAAALVLAVGTTPAYAQLSENKKLLGTFREVVAKANESTVQIRGDDKDIVLGTIVFSDGYILTKASELRGALSVRFSDGAEYEAKIVGKHRDTDLALLRVDAKDLKPVTFVDSKKAIAGNWLAVPSGPKSDPVTVGIVSVGTRKLTGFDAQIDNFNRGYVGIVMAQADPKDKDGKVLGAKVIEVDAKGAGKKAGLKVDDIVTAVDGFKVPGRAALRDALENSRPGELVKLTVLREGEEQELKITLTGEIRPDRGTIQNGMGGPLSGRRTGFPAVLQTDMVLSPKDCGGPAVDLDGNVLGINIARAGRVETWILPSENIKPLLSDLKAGKFAPIAVTKNKDKN